MTSQTKGWMKNCTLHELEAVIARLSDAECNDQGHYPFQNWQLLRRYLYNHAGFKRDESVDPTGRSLLTSDPNITIPYNISRGFDMEERDVPTFYRTSAQGKHVRDIHILVGVAQVKQEEDMPANITLAFVRRDKLLQHQRKEHGGLWEHRRDQISLHNVKFDEGRILQGCRLRKLSVEGERMCLASRREMHEANETS
ncbi:hypothetical protein GJ744_002566 [Endocarpon pusillum]|uniref:Uncharacterized protein n=1 Tax=Endocarpon pusillum TaxID=364733 RepID=A0A8H7AB32_9EURO|nr:hypothetical protein GJ744_002566 [Endocarpon pusillum]